MVAGVYSAGVKVAQHQTLRSPPFLAARALADGPGRAYLSQACAKNPDAYALCAFRDRPLTAVDDILWSFDPRVGVFEFADYDTRVRMISEQNRFVLGAIRFDPGGILAASAGNFFSQLTTYRIDESYGDPDVFFRQGEFAILAKILPNAEKCIAIRHYCAPALDAGLLDDVILAGLLASLAVMALSARTVAKRAPQLVAAAVATIAMLILNAAVCGVLAEPTERYQDRLDRLIVLIAVWMLAAAPAQSDGSCGPIAAEPGTRAFALA